MLREDSVKDIGALLDWIATQPDLDADAGRRSPAARTAASCRWPCMTHYSDRIRAGIDVVGISNFVTFLENTQELPPRPAPRRVRRRARSRRCATFLERISPLTTSTKITDAAAGRPGPERPARAALRVRADRRRGPQERRAGLVRRGQERGPRLREEGRTRTTSSELLEVRSSSDSCWMRNRNDGVWVPRVVLDQCCHRFRLLDRNSGTSLA